MRRRAISGFSLIELAIGMVVIALLLGGIMVPLRTQLETRKIDETQKILAQARDAVLGYVLANGYFPCPATDTSNGTEALPAEPPPAHDAAAGICAAATGDGTAGYHGWLPARTLGFAPIDDEGYAVDAWGVKSNRIRYSVYTDANTAVGKSLVRSGGMAALGIPALGSATLFNVCLSGTGVGATDCGAGLPPTQVTLSTNAAVMIWSVGPRSAPASVHESENSTIANRVFVNRTRSDATGAEFDDVLTWIPITTVISRMVAGGQLP